MHISVVIPTYNGKKQLQRNLDAVLAALKNGDSLIIVDDASTDSTAKWLRKQFQLQKQTTHIADHLKINQLCNKSIEFSLHEGTWNVGKKKGQALFVQLEENQRFGVAANMGTVFVDTDYFVLINNDVAPHLESFKKALKTIRASSSIFGVGFLEHENNVLGGKNKLWFERGFFIHSRADNFESGPTGWVSGGSGIFDTQKWLQLKGFDTSYYPAYWEDIDLSFRARQHGWQVLFEAQAEVDHLHETTNQTVFGQRKIHQMSLKNSFVFIWKNGSLSQKIAHLLWQPYYVVRSLVKREWTYFSAWLLFIRQIIRGTMKK